MTAIFPSRLWWTGWLLHNPQSIDGQHWWIIVSSDLYVKRGLGAPGAREEAIAWCARHCEHDYSVGYAELITFKSEADAMLFKLAFTKL